MTAAGHVRISNTKEKINITSYYTTPYLPGRRFQIQDICYSGPAKKNFPI